MNPDRVLVMNPEYVYIGMLTGILVTPASTHRLWISVSSYLFLVRIEKLHTFHARNKLVCMHGWCRH